MALDEETHQRISPLLPWEDQELPCVTIGNVNETKRGRLYREPLLTLSVPNILLCKWHYENQPELISVLNASIIQQAIEIHEHCERLESHLHVLCCKVGSLYKSAKGRKKRTILEGQTNIFVLSGEMVACDEHSTLMEDYATVTLKCEGLEAEIDNLRKTLIAQQHSQHTHNTVVLNRGRPLDELSPRQARRKLQDFKANAESVLWFAESFGMIPTCRASFKTCSNRNPCHDPVKFQSIN